MKSDLQQAERLLTKYGHAGQASVVSALQDMEEHDQAAFRRKIQSVEMWGGAGAVWEVSLDREGVPREEAERDLHCLWEALIRIAQQMEHLGLDTDSSREIARTLERWLGQSLARAAPYTPPPRPADIEAEIAFLATSEGGRQGPARSGYRSPHDFGLEDGLSDAQHEYPDDHWVFPGHTARTLLWFLCPDRQQGRLSPGFTFAVKEGARVVGHGKIVKILNEELRRGV